MSIVHFSYHTGLRQRLFSNVRLCGSWNAAGRFSADWSEQPMREVQQPDGSFSFEASVTLGGPDTFEWGVKLDSRVGSEVRQEQWGIAAEHKDWRSRRQTRRFTVGPAGQHEEYYLTCLSRLGANVQRNLSPRRVRFAVWAPNARAASVVLGDPAVGYIGDGGENAVDEHIMARLPGGVWQTEIDLLDADDTVYMFKLENDAGRTVYRTDLYSRCQVGSGSHDPQGDRSRVPPLELDARVSCSFVMDPSRIEHPIGSNRFVSEDTFWQNEFDPARPVPKLPSDLVIYELHVGALGFREHAAPDERARPGTLQDAIELIPYLEELGVGCRVSLRRVSRRSDHVDSRLPHPRRGRPRGDAGQDLRSQAAGVPMFFMGEEVGAAKYYTNEHWFDNREDLLSLRSNGGAGMFRFYQELIALRRRLPALRSANIKVVHADNGNRVIAFKRWSDRSEALVLATLSNTPFAAGYRIAHDHIPGGAWREVFSSDSRAYGGLDFGNGGATFSNRQGSFEAVLPPNGFVVFERV